MKQDNVIVYTLSNVCVSQNTQWTFYNENPDVGAIKRSQEFYDAIYKHVNLKYWACGRYGQHSYSQAAGEEWADRIKLFINELTNSGEKIDYSIQMCGHPNLVHPYPYFIVVDYMPYVDISMMDYDHWPIIKQKEHQHEQENLYKNAQGIICFTPVLRHLLINYFEVDPCKVTSICSGVNGFVDINYQKSPEKIILWVGQDYERKGGDDVIKAFSIFRQSHPDYKLYMVGVNKDINEPNVKIFPFLHGDELNILDNLYKKAKMFVMPSYRENLGLVYLEAMARKTPIIATTRGGLAQMLRQSNSGLVVKPGNIKMLVNSMMLLAENEEMYHYYSNKAYMFSYNNARWDIFTCRLFDAIKKWNNGEEVVEDYNIYDF